MVAGLDSSKIATVFASLLILAPLPAGEAEPTPPMVQRQASDDSALTLTFPPPPLRAIAFSAVRSSVVFAGPLNSVALVEETVRARRSESGPRQTAVRAPARQAVADADAGQARPAANPFEEPALEEFPGAVAVAVPRLAVNAKWRRVLEAAPDKVHPITCGTDVAGGKCADSLWSRWHALVQNVSALEGEARLQAANEAINGLLLYASDEEVYGVGDHWATLEESMSHGRGDCEDIAIAKMWLLNAAGVELSSMRLVVLKDTLRNLDHAVLSVVENGHQYILDNATRSIGHAPWMRGYRPIYALSSEESWIFGMRTPAARPIQVAQSTSPTLPQ
jgi:predicted transglutaminase-like cysteine proteinase